MRKLKYFAHVLFSISLSTNAEEFNTRRLEALGIDKNVTHYFSKGERFLPGIVNTNIIVNGTRSFRTDAKIAADGNLCIDEDFLDRIEIKKAKLASLGFQKLEGCATLDTIYPGASVLQVPSEDKIKISVPPDAVDYNGKFTEGGAAGVLNYTAYTSHSDFSGSKSNSSNLNLEAGVNLLNWILRSQNNFYKNDGAFKSETIYTYGQRTLPELNSTMQIGQIRLRNSVLSGVPINGIHFTPEKSLINAGVTVSGISDASQSIMEVRQSGQVIYSTIVPAGPFKIDNVPAALNEGDLDVKITSPSGSSRTYIIPSSSFRSPLQNNTGIYFGIGKYRGKVPKEISRPTILSASNGWKLNKDRAINAGTIISEDYQSIGGEVSAIINNAINLSSDLTFSNYKNNMSSGLKLGSNISYTLTNGISLFSGVSFYSTGYRELYDTLQSNSVNYRSKEFYGGASWGNEKVGYFSGSFSESRAVAQNSGDGSSYTLNWSKNFSYGRVSINWQQTNRTNIDNENNIDRRFFVNVSLPLNNRVQTRIYYRNSNEREVAGSQINASTDESTYSLGAEQNTKDGKDGSIFGGVNKNLHYTNAGFYASTSRDDFRVYSATISGAVVGHKSGVTFSPYPVSDTFGVIKLNNEVSGIKIDTPRGPVWTDIYGQAVASNLNPYQQSYIQIDTDKLVKDVDVENGVSVVNPARGSISDINFKIINTRNAILIVSTANGKPLPKGSSILMNNGTYVTTAVEDGTVFINDLDPEVKYQAELSGETGKVCTFEFTKSLETNTEEKIKKFFAKCL